MSKWNTESIVADLRGLFPGIAVAYTTGEDHTTDQIVIYLDKNASKLLMRGFDPDATLENNNDVDVEMVELSDGTDGAGGLGSKDYRVAKAYIVARQYFIDHGFLIEANLGAYF